MPVATLMREGVLESAGDDFAALDAALQETFAEYVISGGYKQSLELLLQGAVDVAGGAADAPERFLSEEERSQIKILARLGQVPTHPIMVRADLSSDLESRFIAAMLELNEEENQEILQNLYGVDGLAVANTDEHLQEFGALFDAFQGVREKFLE
jgi:ABC-type phosphate/phosphonate transport system substrate-binding protein